MFEQLAHGVGPFKYKFHQVAFYTPKFDTALDAWIDLGYTSWSYDRALLKGVLNKEKPFDKPVWEPTETQARMAFNYDIFPTGVEVELLQYNGPLHEWKTAGRDAGDAFISHISVYTEDLDKEVARCEVEWGRTPYHLFTTGEHSNPRIRGKKKFTETIIPMRDIFGFDVKFISKVDWKYSPDYTAYVPGYLH